MVSHKTKLDLIKEVVGTLEFLKWRLLSLYKEIERESLHTHTKRNIKRFEKEIYPYLRKENHE